MERPRLPGNQAPNHRDERHGLEVRGAITATVENDGSTIHVLEHVDHELHRFQVQSTKIFDSIVSLISYNQPKTSLRTRITV